MVLLMVLFAAIIGSAGMVTVIWWIHQRISRLEDGSPGEVRRLLSESASLHEQVAAIRSELRALDERLGFTEQLVDQKQKNRAIRSPASE